MPLHHEMNGSFASSSSSSACLQLNLVLDDQMKSNRLFNRAEHTRTGHRAALHAKCTNAINSITSDASWFMINLYSLDSFYRCTPTLKTQFSMKVHNNLCLRVKLINPLTSPVSVTSEELLYTKLLYPTSQLIILHVEPSHFQFT